MGGELRSLAVYLVKHGSAAQALVMFDISI
jgi:hypothetical protein